MCLFSHPPQACAPPATPGQSTIVGLRRFRAASSWGSRMSLPCVGATPGGPPIINEKTAPRRLAALSADFRGEVMLNFLPHQASFQSKGRQSHAGPFSSVAYCCCLFLCPFTTDGGGRESAGGARKGGAGERMMAPGPPGAFPVMGGWQEEAWAEPVTELPLLQGTFSRLPSLSAPSPGRPGRRWVSSPRVHGFFSLISQQAGNSTHRA